MSVRPINNNLKTHLYNNEPYVVAHLVKFEKPTLDIFYNGKGTGEATEYVYITDAAYNIEFDDGSYSHQQQMQLEKDAFNNVSPSTAVPNGTQNYIANKLQKIGNINESVEAKASNLSLTLDSAALGSNAFASCTFYNGEELLGTDVDLSEMGFSEGDSISFEGADANNGLILRIDGFSTAGVKVTVVSGTWTNETSKNYLISLVSEEISTLILGNDNVSYTNYINREVSVYRIHINPETNEIIGGIPGFYNNTYDLKGAVLLFKGIITNASLNEDPLKSSSVTWTISSHWGDFVKVQNRITNDAAHRALNPDGLPDLNMVIRPEYASDFGFEHSDRSMNLVATYNTKETRTKITYKKKNLGLSKKVIFKDYQVDVPRDTDLRINLESKALPVIYGVQKVDSIPIFFDNNKNKSDEVYVAYAIAEGKIGGLYDVVIDNRSTVCLDETDKDTREIQGESNTVGVVCHGRVDQGIVLEGTDTKVGVGIYTQHNYNYKKSGLFGLNSEMHYEQNTKVKKAGTTGLKGILNETAFKFDNPLDFTLISHQGSPSQRANDLLVSKATSKSFKIQNDFYEKDPLQYWTTNHRLLDTAYVVAEYKIADGETTIPELDFVVRGKEIECNNYDYSYEHHKYRYPSESPIHFNVGDSVYLSFDGVQESSTTLIIDKWSFLDVDGQTQHRFRWEQAIPSTASTITMSTADNSKHWHMLVADTDLVFGQVAADLTADTSSFSNGSNNDLDIAIQNVSDAMSAALGAKDTYTRNGETVTESTARVNPHTPAPNLSGIFASFFGRSRAKSTLQPTDFDNNTIEGIGGLTDDGLSTTEYSKVLVNNAIQLPVESTPVTDNRYVGQNIVLVRYENNVPYTQVRKIIKWVATASYAVAFVETPWDEQFHPQSGDSFRIKTAKDMRISINPAIQLLDYVQSKRYGKGLDKELVDLETFKQAARACDTRSDITVIIEDPSTVPVPGARYKYTHGGNIHFMGKVSSVSPSFNEGGTDYRKLVLTDCSGKLLSKFTKSRAINNHSLVWRRVSSTSIELKRSEGALLSSDSDWNALTTVSSVSLTKMSGTGSSSLSLDIGTIGEAADGNPIIKAPDSSGGYTASGYSLYDSDNIKYWKYLGWDSHAQRNVTRHQFNLAVDTKNTVFDNINSMLRQFNGILRYANGKYQLQVKSASNPATSSYEKVYDEDIVGSIKVDDKGSKKTFNSVSATIIDPQLGFEGRSISFFNSNYLREDKGIPKKGSFATPSITNYYNARTNIQQFLDESRNGLSIQFTARPSALMLMAGEIFELTNSKFGWVDKKFRITNLNFLSNGLVSIAADEHSDGAYLIPALEGVPAQETAGSSVFAASTTPLAPLGLNASTNLSGAVELIWQHSQTFNVATHEIQIFRNTVNHRTISTTADGAGANSNQLVLDSINNIAAKTVVSGVNPQNIISAGNFVAGESYRIFSLGTTDWNQAAGTSGVLYNVGDLITIAAEQSGSGNGTVQELQTDITVVSVDTNTKTVTLSRKATWSDEDAVTFTAPKIADVSTANVYSDIITEAGGAPDYYYWIRYQVKRGEVSNIAGASSKVMNSDFFPSTNAGVSGRGLTANYNQARAITLNVSNGLEFVYNNAGTAIESAVASYPTSSTITASGINTQGTETFKFEVIDKVGNVIQNLTQDGQSSTFVFNAPTGASISDGYEALPRTVKVTLTDTVGTDTFTAVDHISFTSTRILVDGDDGDSPIVVTLNNQNHQIPSSLLTNAHDLSGSGTDLFVHEGNHELQYNDTATQTSQLSTGQYFVSRSYTSGMQNTTAISKEGKFARIPDLTQFTSATSAGVATYTITVKTTQGLEHITTIKQHFTANTHARYVLLTMSDPVISFPSSGSLGSAPSITLTVDPKGFVSAHNTVKVTDAQGNVTTVINNTTDTSGTYTAPTTVASYPLTVLAEVREGASGAVTASLTRDISHVSDGEPAPTIEYSNTNHSILVSPNGTPNFTGSGGILKVLEGGSALQLASTTQQTGTPAQNGTYHLNITSVSGHTNLTEPSFQKESLNPVNTIISDFALSASASSYCDELVEHFGSDASSQAYLTIENVATNKLKISIRSADSSAIDHLQIDQTTPNYTSVSAIDSTSVPGTYSRELTYSNSNPPSSVSLDVLWSKTGFAGNWRLRADNNPLSVPFTAVCSNTATFTSPTVYRLAINAKSADGDAFALSKDITFTPISDGEAAVNQKVVFLFKKNDNTFAFDTGKDATDQSFDTPTNGVEEGWSTNQPTLSANGDKIYQVQRLFTSDGNNPQETAWSPPVVVAEKVDGTDAQNQKTVFLFKKNDDTLGFDTGKDATDQTFADPTNGLEDEWSTTQPALTNNNDKVYQVQRLFTSDGASPQEASWSPAVIVAERKDGTDAVNQKIVFVFKKNDDTIGFDTGKDATDQTFATPTNGLEDEWSTTQPALSADGDAVYMSQRLFTSNGASPQDSSWSAPVIVAKRTDGDDAQNQKTVFLFKKNDNTLGFADGKDATDQSFDTPTNGLEDEWSTTQPALSANGDKIYQVQRLFTSDGASPQAASWTAPVIVAERKDGIDGADAQNQKTVFLFKKNDDTVGFDTGKDATDQSFDTPTNGLEGGWTTSQHAITANGDKIYQIQRLFTSDGNSPQEASWSTPVVIAERTDGVDGTDAVNQKVVSVFKLNDNSIGFADGKDATDQTFDTPTNGLEDEWSTTQPALTANGDIVYQSQRLFTSNGASPQEAAWSSPVAVARRTDGTDAVNQKVVFIFRKNDSTVGFAAGKDATDQSFASPTSGLEDEWTTTQPASIC